MRRNAWLIAALVLAGLWAWSRFGAQLPAPAADTPVAGHPAGDRTPARRGYPAWLPAEARDTLTLIERGRRVPHRLDGAIFQTRQLLLPAQPRGHYPEYL